MCNFTFIFYEPRDIIHVHPSPPSSVFVSAVFVFLSSLHLLRELLILTNTDGKIRAYGFYFRVVSVEVFSSEKIITKLQLRWLTHFRYAWQLSLWGFDPTTKMTHTVHHLWEMSVSPTLCLSPGVAFHLDVNTEEVSTVAWCHHILWNKNDVWSKYVIYE